MTSLTLGVLVICLFALPAYSAVADGSYYGGQNNGVGYRNDWWRGDRGYGRRDGGWSYLDRGNNDYWNDGRGGRGDGRYGDYGNYWSRDGRGSGRGGGLGPYLDGGYDGYWRGGRGDGRYGGFDNYWRDGRYGGSDGYRMGGRYGDYWRGGRGDGRYGGSDDYWRGGRGDGRYGGFDNYWRDGRYGGSDGYRMGGRYGDYWRGGRGDGRYGGSDDYWRGGRGDGRYGGFGGYWMGGRGDGRYGGFDDYRRDGRGYGGRYAAFSGIRSNDQYFYRPGRVRFDDIITNVNRAYNPVRGVFTAPEPGIYSIKYNVQSKPNSDRPAHVDLLRNGEAINSAFGIGRSGTPSNAAVLFLDRFDTLSLRGRAGTVIGCENNGLCTFNIALVKRGRFYDFNNRRGYQTRRW